jgi:hypothetical protein
LKITDRARETVNSGDDEGVTFPEEVEKDLKLGPTFAAGAASLLNPDDLAASASQGLLLDVGVLVDGADPGVAVESHSIPPASRLHLDPLDVES